MTRTEIAAEASRRAMAASGLTAAARKTFAAQIEADLIVEAEALTRSAAAELADAERQAERARIALVIRAGSDWGRPRQAARLALTTPLAADAAARVVQTFPPDRNAPLEALAMPSPDATGTFGTTAAHAERRRVAAILSHPEAAGRFTAASGFAVDTGMDADAVLAVLAMMPTSPARNFSSLAERAAEAGDFGSSCGDGRPAGRGDMWTKAAAAANAKIGAGAAAAASAVAATDAPALDQASLTRLAAARGEGG